MNNPINDLIIRIKNGYMSKRESITSPHSRFRSDVLKKLKDLKFIEDFTVDKESNEITIVLKYTNKMPAMTDVKIHSTSGRRLYVSYRNIKPVLSGLGYSILSTSKGIMTNREIKKTKLGGELLFSIW